MYLKERIVTCRSRLREHLPYLLALAAIHGVLYRSYWAGSLFFTGKDFLLAYVPFINFQTDCLSSGSIPLWNPFIDFGFPWIDHYINSALFPTHLAMGLVTGSNLVVIQREVLCWLLAGGVGMYLCVTELGHSKLSGLIAGICFIFSGPLMSLPNWSQVVYNACAFPYLIYGYHRAKRLNDAVSVTAILFLSMSFLGGHPPSFVLSVYIFAAYVLIDCIIERNVLFGMKLLGFALSLTGLLILPKLAPFYAAMKASPRMSPQVYVDHAGEIFTAINVTNLPSLVLPVKYFFSLYMGEVYVLVLLYGAIKRRLRFNALIALAALTVWLFTVNSEGQVSALRSLSYFLPFSRLIHNEWMYWYFPVIFCILYLSRYLDQFLFSGERKYQLASGVLCVLVTTVVFLAEYNVRAFLGAFIVQIVLALLWTASTFSARRPAVFFLAVCGLLTAEYAFLVNRVSIDTPPTWDDTSVTLRLTDQWMANKSLDHTVQLSRPALEMRFLRDDQRPSVDESKHWAHLDPAIDTLDPNRANRIVDNLNQKRFAGYAYNAQPKWEFTELRKSPLMEALDGAPLAMLGDSQTGALSSEAVRIDEISCNDLTFRVRADNAGMFLLHQMFDERWTVRVDGKKGRIENVNGFFMGVPVAPGAHTIQFAFRDAVFSGSLVVSAGVLSAFVVTMGYRRLRKGRRAEDGSS